MVVNPDGADVYIPAEKTKTPWKTQKTTTLNVKMPAKGGPVFTFSLAGVLAPWKNLLFPPWKKILPTPMHTTARRFLPEIKSELCISFGSNLGAHLIAIDAKGSHGWWRTSAIRKKWSSRHVERKPWWSSLSPFSASFAGTVPNTRLG